MVYTKLVACFFLFIVFVVHISPFSEKGISLRFAKFACKIGGIALILHPKSSVTSHLGYYKNKNNNKKNSGKVRFSFGFIRKKKKKTLLCGLFEKNKCMLPPKMNRNPTVWKQRRFSRKQNASKTLDVHLDEFCQTANWKKGESENNFLMQGWG